MVILVHNRRAVVDRQRSEVGGADVHIDRDIRAGPVQDDVVARRRSLIRAPAGAASPVAVAGGFPGVGRQHARIPRDAGRGQRRTRRGRQFPRAAERGVAHQAARGDDIGAGRLRQTRDEGIARLARRRFAAPQPEFTVNRERAADGLQRFRFLRQRFARPIAGREAHAPRRAVRDHMHGRQTAPSSQRRRNLARGRALRLEHDRLDAGAKMADEGVDMRDGGVDEEKFEGAGHGCGPCETEERGGKVGAHCGS